jgi:ABC-type uncharacterized transport system substrate-binding protein
MRICVRRREFIATLGIAFVAWAQIAQAQQRDVMRRVGVLTGASTRDSDQRLRVFVEELARLGWTEGVNVQFESRRGGGDPDAIRRYAEELAVLAPDVIFAIGGTATEQLLRALPPGRERLLTKPEPTGSGTMEKTIGIFRAPRRSLG